MRFKKLDLNLLAGLDALLTERSITRAARHLNLSQLATSGVLARLRDYFDDDLLTQVGRNMLLTPMAESLADPVRNILLQIQSTIEIRVAFSARDSTRHFRVIASDYPTSVLLTEVTRRLSVLAPGITLEILAPDEAPHLQLDRGDVDLLIMPEKFILGEHPGAVLFEDSYSCVVWSGNTLVRDSISREQYLSLGHVATLWGKLTLAALLLAVILILVREGFDGRALRYWLLDGHRHLGLLVLGQTGSECAACHIGAYGPHLTAFGQQFKIAGYTDTGGGQGANAVPLAARLRLNNINPVRGGSDTRVDEADIYLAGRLMDNVGGLVDVRRDEGANGDSKTYLRSLDLRYVREVKLGGQDALLGLTLNNNPGIQDPIDANMAWGFPAIATDGSLFNPTPGSGQLPGRVLGLTAYVYADKAWYAEAGGYRTMSRSLQDRLRLDPAARDPGAMDGIAPYWRLAYIRDFKSQAVSLGLYGMNADKRLIVLSAPGAPRLTERGGPANRYRDVGIDANYLYRGDRSNSWQLRANFVEERRDYGSTPVVFGRTAGAAGKVREATFVATYSFNETWSASAARLRSRTSQNAVRYLNGTANSDLKYYEVAWVPFGKEDSWGSPWANLRILAAWLKFNKFNGASNDIFGARFGGPLVNANDLSSMQISATLAF